MDCDLHQIISSKQSLGDLHFKCFTKQLLEGIKAMHSVGIFRKYQGVMICYVVGSPYKMFVDRDLKPGNLLVTRDCKLRITDFGLARFMDDATLQGKMFDTVVSQMS
jgi:serine/threonine protein kinase